MSVPDPRAGSRFSTALRGYNTGEVDRYVTVVAQQIDELERERSRLLAELEAVTAERDAARTRLDDAAHEQTDAERFSDRVRAIDALIASVASEVARRLGAVAADLPDTASAVAALKRKLAEPEAPREPDPRVPEPAVRVEPEPRMRATWAPREPEPTRLRAPEPEPREVATELPPLAPSATREAEVVWGPERAPIPAQDSDEPDEEEPTLLRPDERRPAVEWSRPARIDDELAWDDEDEELPMQWRDERARPEPAPDLDEPEDRPAGPLRGTWEPPERRGSDDRSGRRD